MQNFGPRMKHLHNLQKPLKDSNRSVPTVLRVVSSQKLAKAKFFFVGCSFPVPNVLCASLRKIVLGTRRRGMSVSWRGTLACTQAQDALICCCWFAGRSDQSLFLHCKTWLQWRKKKIKKMKRLVKIVHQSWSNSIVVWVTREYTGHFHQSHVADSLLEIFRTSDGVSRPNGRWPLAIEKYLLSCFDTAGKILLPSSCWRFKLRFLTSFFCSCASVFLCANPKRCAKSFCFVAASYYLRASGIEVFAQKFTSLSQSARCCSRVDRQTLSRRIILTNGYFCSISLSQSGWNQSRTVKQVIAPRMLLLLRQAKRYFHTHCFFTFESPWRLQNWLWL